MGTSPPLSRRRVLQGAALTGAGLALDGCASRAGSGARTAREGLQDQRIGDSSATGSGPDVRLVRAALADEYAVLVVCLGSLAGRPSLRSLLAPVMAQQRAHISALRGALTDPGHAPAAEARRFSGSRQDALHRVRAALLVAQRSRHDDALAADSGLLARLLASVSASHAVAAASGDLRP